MRKTIFTLFLALTASVGTMMAALPEGALKGLFTINSSGDKVAFSQGNLQYQAAPTATWQFAATQWEALSEATNELISPTYDGWIDLFGWNTANNPTNISTIDTDYPNDFVDWGIHPISNGGNKANAWRTLSDTEWNYILTYRPDAADLYGQATVNGVYGVVLLPDNWELPDGVTFTPSPNNWTTNDYDAEAWEKMEDNGAVFFPKKFTRGGTSVYEEQFARYWLGTKYGDTMAERFLFKETQIFTPDPGPRYLGSYVRLVKSGPKVGDTIRYEYKGNNLYYKISYKQPTYKTVFLVNDGTSSTSWTEANKPTGDLVIPDSVEDWQGTKYAVTEMYQRVFQGCSELTSIDFSENKQISTISFCGFSGCTNVESVTLSDHITTILGYGFQNLTKLNSIDLKNVERINLAAFSMCPISEVNLPKTLKILEPNTQLFANANTITVDAENPNFTVIDNVLYNKDVTKIFAFPGKFTSANEIHIPATVTEGLGGALRNCYATVYINSEITFDDHGWSCSPAGAVVVGCGLYDFYTTGYYEGAGGHSTGDFQYITDLSEQLLWKVEATADANGSVALTDTTDCNKVTITATPAAGYRFVKWSDENTDNPRTLDVTADVNLTAFFDVATGVEEVSGQTSEISSQKILRNGHLYIIRDGKVYNVQGIRVE